jgi:hypothetical protein
MRVTLTTDRVFNYGRVQRRGEVIEVDSDEALRLIRANQAEPVETIETAMDEPREVFRGHRRNKHATSGK